MSTTRSRPQNLFVYAHGECNASATLAAMVVYVENRNHSERDDCKILGNEEPSLVSPTRAAYTAIARALLFAPPANLIIIRSTHADCVAIVRRLLEERKDASTFDVWLAQQAEAGLLQRIFVEICIRERKEGGFKVELEVVGEETHGVEVAETMRMVVGRAGEALNSAAPTA